LLDPNGAYVQNAWRTSVQPLSQQLGVPMKLPPVIPRTRLAHEAVAFARRQGKGEELAGALFRAYWQEERDIGQIDVLCDVGRSVGLDPGALRECLEQRTLKDEVEAELQLAQRYQITAVPTFIVGNRFMLRGLVSEEQLMRAIQMCRGEGLVQLE
jgi:predicted DsbA family dithiol-disulfide isomerase